MKVKYKEYTDPKISALVEFHKDNEAVLAEVNIGDKIYGINSLSRKDCLEVEKILQNYGFKTRMAQNAESKEWSVAIIGRKF